jgi:hypothetical protein
MTTSKTARLFSYIDWISGLARPFARGYFLFALLSIFVACAGEDQAPTSAKSESDNQAGVNLAGRAKKLKEAEKNFARYDAPYIVIDINKRKIDIKARGYVLNEFDLEITSDPGELHDFISAVREKDDAGFKIDRVHMFRGIKLVGELEMAAVATALNVDYDNIQKYSPLDMSLSLSPGLIIRVGSDGEGERLGFFSNLAESTRLFFHGLFGAKTIHLGLKTSNAMAIYGACKDRPLEVLII